MNRLSPANLYSVCDLGSGGRIMGLGLKVEGLGFRVQGSGLRIQGSGFRVQGVGSRIQGSGCRVQGSGFRVQGSGFRVHAPGREDGLGVAGQVALELEAHLCVPQRDVGRPVCHLIPCEMLLGWYLLGYL